MMQLSLPTDRMCCSDGQMVTSNTSDVCALNSLGLMSGTRFSSLSFELASTARSLIVLTNESQHAVNAKHPSLDSVRFWMK